MTSGSRQPQLPSQIAKRSQQVHLSGFMVHDEEPPRSPSRIIHLDDPAAATKRRTPIPHRIAPFRAGRAAQTGITQGNSSHPSFLWKTAKSALFTIPYLVGVIVILYYIFQWFYILFRWFLELWPQIANSPVLPSLANISSIFQGVAVIVGFFIFIFKLFKKVK